MHHKRLIILLAIMLSACNTETPLVKDDMMVTSGDANGFLIVDCLLPGQVRKLGRVSTYITQRRPIKTAAANCEFRGGEYVAYDRADYKTAIKVWLAAAQGGDAKAQTYVGEAYEKGLGIPPDYEKAAQWYQKAADQGYASAQMNLGFLYETGLGVEQDSVMAAKLYRQAAGLPEKRGKDTSNDDLERLYAEIASLRGQLRETQDKLHETEAQLKEQDEAAVLRKQLRQTEQQLQKSQAKLDKECRTRGNVLRFCEDSQANDHVDLPLGKYHALIIGNNKYQHWPNLKTAVHDAKTVDELLRQRYGYETTVLLNANRYQILEALNQLRKRLTEEDNLLVYYAGHGELDKVNQRGHWVPVDATEDSTTNWISNIQITDILNTMSSKHILVVADSCYSGAMTRSSLTRLEAGMTSQKRLKWIKTMLEKQSRTALTSGGLKPVLDSGGGQHSIFAKAFIDSLTKNTEILETYKLYQQVSTLVSDAAGGFEQVPEYAPLKYAMHEAGEFFFVPVGGQAK